MRPRITLSTFRRVARTEDIMMRAVMPRTAAADHVALETPFMTAAPARRTWRAGKVVAPLTFTMREVRRG